MNSVLIVESGGTRSEWCLVKNGSVVKRFSSTRLHPSNWSTAFWKRLQAQISDITHDAKLAFYIAGCHNEQNRLTMISKLREFGYADVEVFSDLVAAGLSTGEDHCNVIILGTGSVLFEFESGLVSNVVGGLGHVEGDEGSGYYFGKLVLNAYQNQELNEEQRSVLNSKVDVEQLLELLREDKGKYEIAHLALTVTATGWVI